jgi:RimJ/RimL family protein N-acetyltransferase
LTSGECVLRTTRLLLTPLRRQDEADHALASGRPDDAARDAGSADEHWRTHGFGLWAVRDRDDSSFLGVAELHLAGAGIEGIGAEEVEAGWWVTESRRGEGIATEAMTAALEDLWSRTRAECVAAYIDPGNAPSQRVAAKLGFAVRGPGRGRSGEPMTVYELRKRV